MESFLATPAQLLETLAQSHCVPRTASPCHCALATCEGWSSITEARWPAAQMQPLGTLRNTEVAEPTYEEWHPARTRYDSPDAPVAVGWFPYNRCDLHRCRDCGVAVMRYTEFGGYYVDHRARRIDAGLVDDSAPPASGA
ncbi:MAG: hypothetical protein EBS99_14885 [Betaproteobacteria bacterium]|nr:hypothetical protein [Betaproteobacteria bacterium]